MIVRPFTLTESIALIRLSVIISSDVDAELGSLLSRLAGGDDETIPLIHDRTNIIGRPEIADRIRQLMLDR